MEGTTLATKISWCDETINPIVGCSKINAGCQNCYAENMAARLASMGAGQYQSVTSFRRWNGLTAFVESELWKPHRWKKPRSIFISSMGDLFHDTVNIKWQLDVLDMVYGCPQHTFIMLTKRPENMRLVVNAYAEKNGILPNLVLGVSVEDQPTADERIPYLLATLAAKRFISLEPMIGPVNLDRIHEQSDDGCTHAWESCLDGKRFDPWSDGTIDGMPQLDGVILGGESGPQARPLHPGWVRTIRDQCESAEVSFMFKQWGEFAPFFDSTASRGSFHWPDGERVIRVGKQIAGNVLDGKTHLALPWR